MWWLAQDGSCPTCRRAVSAPPPMNQPPPPSPGSTTTFRFGGGFGFLRLPSFSIEFSTGSTALNPFLRRPTQHDDSQLTGMANQVNEMFPQIPVETIIEDLRVTGSTQATIENILEGRVGFMAGIMGNDDDEHPWRVNGGAGDSDDLLFDDDDDSSGEDAASSSDSAFTPSPPQRTASGDPTSSSTAEEDLTPYQIAKREMIALHRR
ncbi:unnamed protein product [Cylicostephanus goldi]|uniref:CUE domain-containing protein n=1 Tax=Cylicostephanus goldi TaxID=71465 RepID=A0A3P6R8X6_CYLGO|nr:unnamed protein product [Cylicostephanus goldi]